MKTLVVYYSRTGTTRKVAGTLAERLGADLEELMDTKSRKGVIGWLRAARDGTKKALVPIGPVTYDPGQYDVVLVGTPIWGGQICAAVRTYLTENGARVGKVGFFMTHGFPHPAPVFPEMQQLCGRAPVATVALRAKQVSSDQHLGELGAFIAQLSD